MRLVQHHARPQDSCDFDITQIESLCFNFPNLSSLSLAGSQLRTIPSKVALPTCIKTLNLESNQFECLADIAHLAKALPRLERLNMKHNNITSIAWHSQDKPPMMPASLTEVDLSFNRISEWAFVDSLAVVFPGLKAVRLSHNELYQSEDAFTSTVARVGKLEMLNYSTVSLHSLCVPRGTADKSIDHAERAT